MIDRDIIAINSVRFIPNWDDKNTEQIEGLINLMFYIYNNNPRASIMAEVGSWIGESSSIFLSFPFIKELYCIDIWKERHIEEIFLKRMNNLILQKRCHVLKDTSKNASQLHKTFDIIYIDAAHDFDNVSQDIELWSKKINKNGFLCGHDYTSSWQGVVKAVDIFKQRNKDNFINFKTFKDNSWCLQYINN